MLIMHIGFLACFHAIQYPSDTRYKANAFNSSKYFELKGSRFWMGAVDEHTDR